MATIKKHKKNAVIDLVWELMDAYDGETDEYPEWGAQLFFGMKDEDRKSERERVKNEVVMSVLDDFRFPKELVEDLLGKIENLKEHTCADERETSDSVKDWSNLLYKSLGKEGGDKEKEFLRTLVDGLVTSSSTEKEMHDALSKVNVPDQLMDCLLHFGRISKLTQSPDDIKYRQSRLETYETCLNEAKHFVTVPSGT